jgi:spore germination protein
MKKFNKTHKLYLLSILVFLLLFLTGCWSSTPIEDLNIVVGSALDKAKDGKIRSTLQYVIPKAISGNSPSGSSQQKPYINVSATGNSIEPIGWATTLTREGPISGAHEKAVVISQELAREVPLQQVTDLYYRDIDIRGSTLIFIAKGSADKILETEEQNVIPAIRLTEIAEQGLTTKELRQQSLMKSWSKFNSKASLLIQVVESKKGGIEFNGAAVIDGKTNKMIGILNKSEIEGINWITGEGKSGSLKAYTKESEKPTYYQIGKIKSKIRPHVKGDKISFDVHIESQGRLAEYWNPQFKPAFKNSTLKKIQKAAEIEVMRRVKKTTKVMQEKYKVDVAGFGNQLGIKYPKVWKKVQKDWDNKFSQVPIKYHVKILITDYGMIGSKKVK